jgi:hypothetical protein
MLTRIAALTLALTTIANAGGFAKPASEDRAEAPRMMRPVPPPPNRDDIKIALAMRREHNLAAFHAYWQGGVYPHNTYRTGPLNVWRDAEGHLCAAATMISKDGHDDLAQKTADSDNNIRLLDVTKGELLDWMLTSGLTIEDIDMIQAPAVMERPRVDAQTIAAEDAKLLKGYKATEIYLKKHVKDDLELATARLLERPELARQLLDS